ncbi:MAG: hypothetical protein ATN35_11505 [Epulopiscium sp. Nele67-Bin004]|nr:MAG: hypothetical protein ATN35_11505 [Epulopiscium sp. Nele67-Bin004]
MRGFAHRGDSVDYPENTMLAFKKALETGIKGIELDVHLSKDNELVVIHDENTERTYTEKFEIKDTQYHIIDNLTPRRELFKKTNDCNICVLEDVLDILETYSDVVLNIELKTDVHPYEGIEKRVIDLVHRYEMEDRIIISSFNHDSLLRCQSIDKNLLYSPLYYKYEEDMVQKAVDNKFYALHVSLMVLMQNRDVVAQAQENGLKVNVYTVNDPKHMRMLQQANVDGIFTDDPKLFLEIF